MDLIPVVPHLTPEKASTLIATSRDTRLAVRIPGQTLANLPSATSEQLSDCDWTFLIGGWSEPVLASLPEGSRRLQIDRELQDFRNLGARNFAGYVGAGWEPQLATLFVESGLPLVFVSWSPPYPVTPVVTDHLGDVVTLIAIGSPLAPVLPEAETPPAGTSSLAEVLAHSEVARAQPVTDRSWANAIDADPEAALLYRKMLRLAGRVRRGTPPEALESLLAAQSGSWFDSGVDRTPAHAALVAARHRIDLARRRPAGWLRITELDWDADTQDEIQIENAHLSTVIDYHAGVIAYVDHKPSERSISYVAGESPWHLARGLTGSQPSRLVFSSCEVDEERGRATVNVAGSGVQLTVSVIESSIGFAYRLHPSLVYERLGPELPLMCEGDVRLKVDGGEWSKITQTHARGGHRFRLDTGGYEVLIALEQPGDLFLRPARGGIVAWPNWPSLTGEYRLNLEVLA